MTDATYEKICQLHQQLIGSDLSVVTEFEKYSDIYWKLRSELPQEQWQTVNTCFCAFHEFYMTMLARALDDTT